MATKGERSGRSEEPLLITPDMLAVERRDARVEFERGMRHAPPLTLLLIGVCVAVFVWEVVTGALASPASIVAAGALLRARVLAGEGWRLLTATLLHGSFDHLVGNAVVLYIVGMASEHALGPPRALLVYGVSALSGSLLSVATGPGPSVGASGAIFGTMASVILVLYRYQDRFYVRDKRIGFVLAVWAAYQIAAGFFTPYVDNFAHIGGFVGGGLATLLLRVPSHHASARPTRVR